MSDTNVVRRLAPTDRRTPVPVKRDCCPLGQVCYCCPNAPERWHGSQYSKRTCDQMHPPKDRECSQPAPLVIAPCPERTALPQEAPPAPAGFRTPHVMCCSDCGRLTGRRWTDGDGRVLAWCAGRFPEPEKM